MTLAFLSTFAQTTSGASCTINGQPADCGKAGGILAAVFIPLMLIGAVLFVFWVISLVHLIQHPDVPNRIVWLILHFVGLNMLAGIIYFFVVKRPYDKQHAMGAGVPAPTTAPSPPPQPPEAPQPPTDPAPPAS
jgi:hypothetical protein